MADGNEDDIKVSKRTLAFRIAAERAARRFNDNALMARIVSLEARVNELEDKLGIPGA